MRHVVIVLTIGAVIALAAISARPTRAADAPAAVAKVKIGTFDTRAIALAYGRSAEFQKVVQAAMAEHKKAKDAGDTKAVEAVEAKMKGLQDKMHWQVFSNWNIDDILPKIKPNYPEIAKKAGVVAIVPSVEFVGAGVETVDVTDLMAAQFSPDEKTKSLMQDMSKSKPLPLEEIKKVKTED